MTRIAVYHRYEYPSLKSRLRTYFMKLFGYPKLINGKLYFINLYRGITWKSLVDIVMGEDKLWRWKLEIIQAEWCDQVQILIIKELKPQ